VLLSVAVAANVNISKQTGYQAAGAIAVDPTNPQRLFAASNLTGTGLFAAYSTDGGSTWTTRTMAGGSDGLPVAFGQASASFDQFGNLFVAYLQTTTSPPNAVVVRSTNAGQTFSLVTSFTASDEPTITTGPGNVGGTASVWCTWLNNSNAIVASGAQVTALNTVGAFSAAATIPGGTGKDFGDIAIGPGGKVMVTYQDNVAGQGASNISVSVDPDGVGGSGFGSAVIATTANVGGFDYLPVQPRRSIDGEAGLAWDHTGGAHNGRVYLIYTGETPDESNDTDIFVRFSDTNGATWSGAVRVNDDATTRSQILPRLALDQTTGNLAATWLDARNDAGAGSATDSDSIANDEVQLFGAVSQTFGASFDLNVPISAGVSRATAQGNVHDFGDYTGLAFQSGAFYPIWPDNSAALGLNPDLPNFDLATAKVTVTAGATAPSNNNFANRITLSGFSATAIGANSNASKEVGEPNHAGDAGGKSVWWSWTAPSSQSYVITTAGSNFDTTLGVYTGNAVGSLTPIASNNDENNPTTLTSRVLFNAVANTTYQIAVDGLAGASGGIDLAISRATHTIGGFTFVDRDTNGSKDAGEPGLGGRTVWLDDNNDGTIDSSFSLLNSADVPKSIIDLATFTSNRNVSGLSGVLTDVNVTLNISHTWDADLDVYLISPTGTRIELFTDVGGSGDNFTNTTLDDEAAFSIALGSAPFSGSFKPGGLLSGFDGQDPNGTWRLEVSDDQPNDSGTLNSWSLTLSVAERTTTSDVNGAYSFPGLYSGSYNVRLATSPPAAGYILTAAVNPRVVNASLGQTYLSENFGYFPIDFNGSTGDDVYTFTKMPGGTTTKILETLGVNPTVTYTIPTATLSPNAVSFTTGAGDDTLIVDYGNGGPIPLGGVTFDGGTNTVTGDTLSVLATASAGDDAQFTPTSAIINSTVTSTSQVEKMTFDGRGGLDNVTVDANAAVTFPTSQHFLSLSIASAASATLASGASRTIYTRTLTLTGSAKLDLTDNDLILDYSGATPLGTYGGSAYTGVTGLVAAGRNGGNWSAASGITTSASPGLLTGLAIADAASAFGLGSGQTKPYGTETLDETSILIKYTYVGDATMDGKLNIDDYVRIDGSIPNHLTGWWNGDLNYDGKLNIDDYVLLDGNIPNASTIL
jgi:subtilisin-like proprotein convertase family protein